MKILYICLFLFINKCKIIVGKLMKNYISFDSMVGDWVYYLNMLIEIYGGLKFVFGKIG